MPRKQKNPRRRAAEQFLIHWTLAVLVIPIRVLPLRAARRLAEVFAWMIGMASYRRRRMADRNLQAVFGDQLTPKQRREIVRNSVTNVAKTMMELIKLQWMGDDELKREASVEGLEHLDAALSRGNGVIIITAHFGNWEYAGAVLSVLGYPINGIARDANDPLTRDLINDARRSKGIRIFGRWDARHLLRALRNSECVAILPDQHAAEAAVRVTFLGRPADTATGPVTFALRTGAPIVPIFGYRQPDDHIRCKILPALELVKTGDRDADVIANVQLINDVIGDQIRDHPEQWLWFHNRWKAAAQLDSEPS